MEDKIKERWPPSQGGLEPLETGRGRKDLPLQLLEGARPCILRTEHE